MVVGMEAIKIVYKELLRAGKLFDDSAGLRATVSSGMLLKEKIRSRNQVIAQNAAYNKLLMKYLHDKAYYTPSFPALSTANDNETHHSYVANEFVSMVKLIRKQFRAESYALDGRAMDTALTALKSLNGQIQLARDIGFYPIKTPYSEQTLKPVHASTAKCIRPGMFLLSHPLMDGIFSRSVIFITQHSKNRGSRGFIVNRPDTEKLFESFQLPSKLRSVFKTNHVYCGGPVLTRHAEILHQCKDIGGVPIAPAPSDSQEGLDSIHPIFLGGNLEAAARAVIEQKTCVSKVVFFNGMSTWFPGQLENEARLGTWTIVDAPIELALGAELDLWSQVMRALGGEYAEWAELPELK